MARNSDLSKNQIIMLDNKRVSSTYRLETRPIRTSTTTSRKPTTTSTTATTRSTESTIDNKNRNGLDKIVERPTDPRSRPNLPSYTSFLSGIGKTIERPTDPRSRPNLPYNTSFLDGLGKTIERPTNPRSRPNLPYNASFLSVLGKIVERPTDPRFRPNLPYYTSFQDGLSKTVEHPTDPRSRPDDLPSYRSFLSGLGQVIDDPLNADSPAIFISDPHRSSSTINSLDLNVQHTAIVGIDTTLECTDDIQLVLPYSESHLECMNDTVSTFSYTESDIEWTYDAEAILSFTQIDLECSYLDAVSTRQFSSVSLSSNESEIYVVEDKLDSTNDSIDFDFSNVPSRDPSLSPTELSRPPSLESINGIENEKDPIESPYSHIEAERGSDIELPTAPRRGEKARVKRLKLSPVDQNETTISTTSGSLESKKRKREMLEEYDTDLSMMPRSKYANTCDLDTTSDLYTKPSSPLDTTIPSPDIHSSPEKPRESYKPKQGKKRAWIDTE